MQLSNEVIAALLASRLDLSKFRASVSRVEVAAYLALADVLARRYASPKGLAGLPAMVAIRLSLPRVPAMVTDLSEALSRALASEEPITLTVRGGGLDVEAVIR